MNYRPTDRFKVAPSESRRVWAGLQGMNGGIGAVRVPERRWQREGSALRYSVQWAIGTLGGLIITCGK